MCPQTEPWSAPVLSQQTVMREDISHGDCKDRKTKRVHLHLRIRTDAKEFAKGHTEALVEVVVDPATSFDPFCTPLQQIQNQRPQVSSNQQSVVLFQQQLGQTLQNTLPVLLAPYLRTDHIGGGAHMKWWLGDIKSHISQHFLKIFTSYRLTRQQSSLLIQHSPK